MKPAIGADGLAAKTQDELTERIVWERQTHVKEIHMTVASAVSIFQDVP